MMPPKPPNKKIFIISAPSGSGKTTLLNKFFEDRSDIRPTVSVTSRPPREGEQNGRDYFFLTSAEFEEKIKADELAEWTRTYDYYYGTLKKQIEDVISDGKSVVLNIDVVGARNIKKLYPEAVSIFIMPPSIEELEKRLINRNLESKDEITKRLRQAKDELACQAEYDHVVVNDNFETALERFTRIIDQATANTHEDNGATV